MSSPTWLRPSKQEFEDMPDAQIMELAIERLTQDLRGVSYLASLDGVPRMTDYQKRLLDFALECLGEMSKGRKGSKKAIIRERIATIERKWLLPKVRF